jgi:hypothetical protein
MSGALVLCSDCSRALRGNPISNCWIRFELGSFLIQLNHMLVLNAKVHYSFSLIGDFDLNGCTMCASIQKLT